MPDLRPASTTNSEPPTNQERIDSAALLAQMGSVLLSLETIDTTVELVTTLAAATIAGTTGAGVTLIRPEGRRSVAPSDPLVERADALQYELDTGPCITAWREQTTVRIDDVSTEQRWPQWCASASEVGVRSTLSVPLVVADTALGAIKVYSTERAAFDTAAEHVLELFARQAAILLANTLTLADARRTNTQLAAALQNRDVIGQAKGILLARGAVDDRTAFAMLVTASQRANTKLHDVARQLVGSVTGHETASAG